MVTQSPVAPAPRPPTTVVAVETALGQSQEVKAKVEACAEDLGTANEAVKERIADGATMLPAGQALRQGQAVEERVQEFVHDLDQVTDNLAQGVDEVRDVARALGRSREALAESETALAASRHAEQEASRRAMHDAKTGLPNRALFDDRLAQALAGAERHGRLLAVMFLDLDRFKVVNDTHGHAAGDAVLATVARRLLEHAREEDTVCRNGGDEFLYLLVDLQGREDVERIADGVLASIARPIGHGALQIVIAPSIGIALYPAHGLTGDALVANADEAMYRAKLRRSGREFFEAPAALSGPPRPAP
jgi:diguanylate cyclase (GGDEF)-like protein